MATKKKRGGGGMSIMERIEQNRENDRRENMSKKQTDDFKNQHANYQTTETNDPNYGHSSDQNYSHATTTNEYTTAANEYYAAVSAGPFANHAMAYNQYGGQGYNAQNAQYSAPPGYGGQYTAPPGYGGQYAQQTQQYETPPQIRNPFMPPPPAASTYASHNSSFDPDHDAQIAQWQAQYAPADQQLRAKKTGRDEPVGNANMAPLGQRGTGTAPAVAEAEKKADGKFTVVRKGGGEQWEDQSLLEWDHTKFRIMVGNLAGEVTDDSLAKAFANYGVSKARVIRDKRTTKSKGFGFVEFEEGELGFKAAREMVGKYIGSHPVTIQRAKTDVRPAVKKDNNKHKGKNNRNNDKKKDQKKNASDPLKAHTGAGIEKKPGTKTAAGLKLLG